MFDRSLDESPSGKGRVPADWDSRIRSELRLGEKLVWVGQPRPAHFARQALPITAFAVVWTALSSVFFVILNVYGTSGRNGQQDPGFVLIVTSLFVLIGVGLLSIPYWLRRQAKHTYYVLTDRRAILWECRWFGNAEVRSYSPEHLTEMFRVEYPRGGDLVFRERVVMSQTSRSNDRSEVQQHGFMGIDNVHEIEALVRKTLLADAD